MLSSFSFSFAALGDSDQYLSEVYPIMTFAIRRLSLPLLSLCWFLSPTLGHAQTTTACTSNLASLQGSYGMLVSGQTVPTANVGQTEKYLAGSLTFDGNGNISASHVYSGSATSSTATGTYVLNSDCTLTLSLTVGSTPTQSFRVAVLSSLEAIGIEADASAVATIDLEAQNSTSSSLAGTFATVCLGSVAAGTVPAVSDLNVATFSGGEISGSGAYNNNGSAAAGQPSSGSYSVNTDGTFSGTLLLNGQTLDVYGVVSNSGAEIEYFYTAASAPTTGLASCVGKK
jgi:hypothetical protein